MPTSDTATVAAVVWIALYVGHHLGDHTLQTCAQAYRKGAPDDPTAHPWQGWALCLRHVATYTAVQGACLGVVALVAPLTWPGVIAALALSGGTHAVIDRRWLVKAIVRAKHAEAWREGPYLIDQSLHYAALLLAAVLGALATTTFRAGAAVLLTAAIVGAGLAAERLRYVAAEVPGVEAAEAGRSTVWPR